MIRKHKGYKRPRKPYEKIRMEEENVLKEAYGLKNKREIWKTAAKLGYFRKRAMALARSSIEEQEVLFRKLTEQGFKVSNITEVLALTLKNILERRLQTLLVRKSLANTMKHARQLIVHQKVVMNGRVVNSPSYLVSVHEEQSISVRQSAKPKLEKPVEEIK